jgi:hypothetical protein
LREHIGNYERELSKKELHRSGHDPNRKLSGDIDSDPLGP